MIDVTCAIIRNENDNVLIVQRAENTDHPLKWEFPGGKTRQGETHEECIVREIKEELSMEIVICFPLEPVEHDYGHKHIKLFPFVCDTLQDEPVLNEHKEFRWVSPDELTAIDFQEADIKVAEQYLKIINGQYSGKPVCNHPFDKPGEKEAVKDEDLVEIINRLMSLKEADWFASSAIENPVVFEKLLKYSFSSDLRLAFRASWVLTKVCDKKADLIRPYLTGIVRQLKNISNTSVARSFMRILSIEDMKNFTDEEHGILADYCLESLSLPETPVAIKAYAMEILYRLTTIYPELGNEVAASIRSLMEKEGSPGIVSKGRIILRKIAGITSDS